jgi:hypothetical protein
MTVGVKVDNMNENAARVVEKDVIGFVDCGTSVMGISPQRFSGGQAQQHTPTERFSEIRKPWIEKPVCLLRLVDPMGDNSRATADVRQPPVPANRIPELRVVCQRQANWCRDGDARP